jgi:hypothetical protein
MRYAEAEYQLRLANEEIERQSRDASLIRQAELAHDQHGGPSLRRRVGAAVIGFGIRLAGDPALLRDGGHLVRRAA